MSSQDLFSFQGKVYLAQKLANGLIGPQRWVGNAPQCQLRLEVQNSDKTESFSGDRLLYGRLAQSKTANVSLTLDEFTPDNVALGLYGTPLLREAGDAPDELLPPDVVVGDTIRLDRSYISDLALTDSATPPAEVPAAKYRIDSVSAGLVTFLDVAGFQQPFKATYKYAAVRNIALFTAPAPERVLLVDGINTVNKRKVIVTLYRVGFNPIEQLDMVSDDWGSLVLSGAALFDETAALDPELGGFGKIEMAVP